MGFPIDCLNLLTKSQRECEGTIIPGFHFVEDIERRPGGWDNVANAKGKIMKGYILRDKEVEDEAKKARKAKKQGQWIVGAMGTSGVCKLMECETPL